MPRRRSNTPVDQYLINHLSSAGWSRTSYSQRLNTGDLEYDNGSLRLRVKHIAKKGSTLLEMQPKGRGRIHLRLEVDNSPDALVRVLIDWQDRLNEGVLPRFMRDIQTAYPNVMGDRTGSGEWAPLGIDGD
jgi:hypothetical protein